MGALVFGGTWTMTRSEAIKAALDLIERGIYGPDANCYSDIFDEGLEGTCSRLESLLEEIRLILERASGDV